MQPGQNELVHEFIRRTMENLKIIQEQECVDDQKFSVTQAINSLLGLLILPVSYLPKENMRDFDDIITNYFNVEFLNNTNREQYPNTLVEVIRHSLAHGQFLFKPNPQHPSQIGSVVMWNCYGNKADIKATIDEDSLYEFIEKLSNKLKEIDFEDKTELFCPSKNKQQTCSI